MVSSSARAATQAIPVDPAAVSERMCAAFSRGDVEALLEEMDPAIVLEDPPEMPDAGTHEGRAAARRFMLDLRDPWERCGMEPLDYKQRGDRLLVRMRFWGKGKTSGLETETEFFQLLSFRDGRVLRSRAFFDGQAARRALKDAAAGGLRRRWARLRRRHA